MGREVKRVPMDFDWPLNKTWDGFLSPDYRSCPDEGVTCFNGQNAAAQFLDELTTMFSLVADSAMKGKNHPTIQQLETYHTLPDWSKQPILIRKKMVTLYQELSNELDSPSPFGFIGSSHGLYFQLLQKAGLYDPDAEGDDKYSWGTCTTCKGESIHPEDKAASDAWEATEPPTGEGWQIWETVSEGSPISPVFATPEELARHMADAHKGSVTDGASYDQWLGMIKSGWAPSMVMDEKGMRSGVEAVGDMESK